VKQKVIIIIAPEALGSTDLVELLFGR